MQKFLTLLFFVCACTPTSKGHAFGAPLRPVAQAPAATRWFDAAPLSHSVLRGSDGQTYLGVWLDVPKDQAGSSARAPMAISLVIDASGSMAGAKIRHARMAATELVERLSEGDEVSLYAYDDEVYEIQRPVRLTREAKQELLRKIADVHDGGSTNMYGGISAGQRAVAEAGEQYAVRRVMVISDGLANVGPSAPDDFARLAEQGTRDGIQVSAIGIGLDYDEHTLGALALHSEGRMYHLAEPEQLAKIVDDELDTLSATVATHARLELVPAPGVTLQGTELGRAQWQGRTLVLPLGSLYAGQERELLIRAQVPTAGAAQLPLATVTLIYDTTTRAHEQQGAVALRYELTDDVHTFENSHDARVESIVASYRAAEQQQKAAALLNEGKNQEAEQALQLAEGQLGVAYDKAPASKKAALQQKRDKTSAQRVRAAGATSKAAARGLALESYDDSLLGM